ncbi:kielin/chordin-like protein [Myxocyprinus asiaticus]|uniref:kielin/chordin-like protein n=1 Tax=Myxocyprinus asiaticus TaxID=70543 RepID=UPI002223618F|nr:kielin/chordin-like protein [Myxocyprinus asiaticus]
MELRLLIGKLVLLSLFVLWDVSDSVHTRQDAKLQHSDENVINLLEALNVAHSRRGVSKAKGRDAGTPAWRFRSSVPHLTLPPDLSRYFLSTSQGVLGLHLVGRQSRVSEATLISFTSPSDLQRDGRPLLELTSNSREDWLQLEFRSVDGLRPQVVKIPGGSPFTGGAWVRIALSVEPRQVLLFLECQEAVVLKLKEGGRILTLDFPQDLQITFSSTAGNKASKFKGLWQTAELSTRIFERRPWFCDNVPDSLPHPVQAQDPVQPNGLPLSPISDMDMMQDQGDLGSEADLGPPRHPLSTYQYTEQLEANLHGINTMLNILKNQNAILQARVKHLETHECVRQKCVWEGRQMEEGSRWSLDSRTVCLCTNGKVQCDHSSECSFHGNIYSNGDVFSPDDCSKCTCGSRRVECDVISCSSLSCLQTFVPLGSCCPLCETRCEHEGEIHENGDVFASRSNPCLKCSCSNSRVSCDPIQCPPTLCPNPYRRPGECCPTCSACDVDGQPYNGSYSTVDGCQTCTCQGGKQACADVHQCPQMCRDGVKLPFGSCCRDCSRCNYEGQIFLDGVSLQVARDPCKHCVCNRGNIVCNTETCPALDCNLVETVGGQCCPRCRSCFEDNVWHLHGSQWKHPNDPCMDCTCTEGQVHCVRALCEVRCSNPASPHPGSCCPVCDGCRVNGVDIPNGQRLPPGPQCEGDCICERGSMRCHQERCPAPNCANPIPPQHNSCCPTCSGCVWNGFQYMEGETWTDAGRSCSCVGGQVTCGDRCAQAPSPPCAEPARTPGCMWNGVVYAEGETWTDAGRSCSCVGGQVTCGDRCAQAPSPPCAEPTRTPGCMWNGVVHAEGETWTDAGRSCSCVGGQVTCSDRCAQAPSPPCAEPARTPGCMWNGVVYAEGETWTDAGRSCSCVGGQVTCGDRCAQAPSPPCAEPTRTPGCMWNGVVHAEGDTWTDAGRSCSCVGGQVTCGDRCAQAPTPPCAEPARTPGCMWNGVVHAEGETWTDAGRSCSCVGGQVTCGDRCAQAPSPPCAEPTRTPGCMWNGVVHAEGDTWTDAGRSCSCVGGQVTCGDRCEQAPTPPCAEPARTPGCMWNGVVHAEGETWTDAGRSCSCVGGQVTCSDRCAQAPSPPCAEPTRTPGCMWNGVVHAEGDTWTDAGRSCSCVGGQVTCSDRCAQAPSPPCAEPARTPGCMWNGVVYAEGETWTDAGRSCSCVGGQVTCGDRCAQAPSPPCAEPARTPGCMWNGVVHAEGDTWTDAGRSCSCVGGQVTCGDRCAQAPTPPCAEPARTPGCMWNGVVYAEGDTWTDAGRSCSCVGGQVTCGDRCAQAPSPPCAEPTRTPGCIWNGVVYAEGETWTDAGRSCCCVGGQVTCSDRCAQAPSPPCAEPARTPGCMWNGVVHAEGDTWTDAGRSCSCVGGQVTCGDRCAQAPSPPCAEPTRTPGCMWNGVVHAEGDTWTDAGRSCSCVGGQVTCGDRCAQAPSPPCAEPARTPGCMWNGVVHAEGETWTDAGRSCSCVGGQVTCGDRCAQAPSPPCAEPARTPDAECCNPCGQCQYKRRIYENGQTFTDPDDACVKCTCQAGQAICGMPGCKEVSCSNPYTPPGECCPRCPDCEYDNRTFTNGATFTNPENLCEDCVCTDGRMNCRSHECPRPNCNNPRPGTCCQNNCNGCRYAGNDYPNGIEFPHPTDRCKTCHCTNGNIRCLMKRCPAVQCADPYVHPGECCPQCPASPLQHPPHCVVEAQFYRHEQQFNHPTGSCQSCLCTNGSVNCRRRPCPSAVCSHPIIQECCRTCDGCLYGGREYANGATFEDASDPCRTCFCRDGTVRCEWKYCQHIACPFPVQGECCPHCDGCRYAGVEYVNGQEFADPADHCSHCVCASGHVNCNRRPCHIPGCSHPISRPDQCCPVCDGCLFHGRVYANSEVFPSPTASCEECRCSNGSVSCTPVSCPEAPCRRPVHPPGECCPVCTGMCEHQGQVHESGSTFTPANDQCSTCTCLLGHIECDLQECPPLDCPDGSVKVKNPGKCCPECTGITAGMCVYKGQLYSHNDHWDVDECTICTCMSGDVHCRTERCPTLTCPSDETPALVPGMCCPHCIPHPATCIVFGDPHYRTFDGKMVNFQGTCTYVLAEDCNGGDFSVRVSNEERGRKGVSWTKEVTVFIGDVVVQLFQDWLVKVDYQTVSLPFLKEPYVYLERMTNTILLNTNVGLKVLWNGRSHLEVSVPGTYMNHMCGLCGNFNNYPQDDMTLRNGQITNSEAAFGNNWKVGSGSLANVQCPDAQNINPCKEAGYRAQRTANAHCAVLKSPMFERCHKVVPPEMFFASCVYDLCACDSNMDECVCDVLEAYASECRKAGVILQWRSPTLCAIGCPLERGYVFDECGLPCPKTCFNKDIPLGVIEAHCFKPCVPGCQCPAGLVEHNAHCIAPEKCPKIIHGNS